MISQFVSPYEQRKLGALAFDFPDGTNAVGRLDDESEGLLILTTDKTLTQRLLHPDKKHSRGYIVQVEKKVNDETLNKLRSGVEILVKGRGVYKTQPCKINIIEKPDFLPLREDPLLDRIPHTWLEFILTEGKNRQIRKMCKGVYHKCCRLIRTRIEDLELKGMKSGEVREIEKEELFRLLRL
ncbi:MAG: pseudouridine synthase [Bacteroidetes bacterium]|nr:pseudouridine synthase [Bacteroidota bacterium]